MNNENLVDLLKTIGVDANSYTLKNEFLEPVKEQIKKMCGKPIYPKPNESLAVAIESPKTAALAFDRVYRVPIIDELVPEEIGFYGATNKEMDWYLMCVIISCALNAGIKVDINYLICKLKFDYSNPRKAYGNNVRDLCSELSELFKQSPTFIYNTDQNYLNDFPSGKLGVLFGAITNFAMVDEKKLEWQQVLEFRKDEESRIKYKRLMRWIDAMLLTKTKTQIEDEIAIKFDDYNWTLKKHGIQTILGTLSSLIDFKFLSSLTAVTAATALSANELWAILVSAGLIVGKTTITFGTKYIDNLDERRKDNFEIAYIYELKKRLK